MTSTENPHANDEVFQSLVSLLNAEPFLVPGSPSPTTPIFSLPEWDSLKHLSLLMELEKRFSQALTPERARDFKTLLDIVQWACP